MLQYLLNATAIWLISLLSYDIFLRRESYHSYNRFYLLFTFLLGALLPMLQWQGGSILPPATQRSVEQVIIVKQSIVTASVLPATQYNWQQWIAAAYAIGALVALCLCAVEIIKLISYARSGIKTTQGRWTIIETGKEHTPFSFRNTLFVCSLHQYGAAEWQMILSHESRHSSLLHLADLILMQLGRIIFWFHPLVYVYNKRLLLVHEYQADSVAAPQPQVYGRFLVEQALLQSAPSVAHSFNRSPIKNRIVMLTRRSTALAKGKMLVFVPVALVCLLCFSKNVFSQGFKKDGNHVSWNGNTFEIATEPNDTVTMIDPVTGKELTKIIAHEPRPTSMNGKPIANEPDRPAQFTGSDKDLRDYILKNMRNELGNLEDGNYVLDIDDVLVDEQGKIVYFNYNNMRRNKSASEVTTPHDPSAPMTVRLGDPNVKITLGNGITPPDGSGGNSEQTKQQYIAENKDMVVKSFKLSRSNDPSNFEELTQKDQQVIFDKVCRLMETAPGFTPGTLHGKNVISQYSGAITFWNSFKIKNHKIYETDSQGEYKEL